MSDSINVSNNNASSSSVDSFNAAVQQETEKKETPAVVARTHLWRNGKGFADSILTLGKVKVDGMIFSAKLDCVVGQAEDINDAHERMSQVYEKAKEATGLSDGVAAIKEQFRQLSELAETVQVKL